MDEGISPKKFLDKLAGYGRDSESTRAMLETSWVENMLLMQGRFSRLSSTTSQVRRRNASFYRLGWAARQEILSAIHTAYLKDEKTVSVIASNDLAGSVLQSEVLDLLLATHIQYLRKDWDLQCAHIAAAANCLDFGFSCGRFLAFPGVSSPYNIGFEVIPPDRLLLDWGRAPSQARFVIIEHWLCEEELNKFSSIFSFINQETLTEGVRPTSAIQDLRMGYAGPGGNTRFGIPIASDSDRFYHLWECYLRVHWGGRAICLRLFTDPYATTQLTDPIQIGNRFPLVFGQAMLNPDVICGDSLAAVVRDPQETFNELMNSRLDNLALTLRPTRLIQRTFGIDKYELARAAAGDIIDVDYGPNIEEGIFTLHTPDVTQGAFQEAQNAANLIRGLAGLPDQLTGTSGTPEGVISQIYQAAAKKIDFLIGTFAQTYWRPWHDLLIDIISQNDDDAIFQRALQSALVGKTDPERYAQINIRQQTDVNCQVILAHATKQLPADMSVYLGIINQASTLNQQTLALISAGVLKRENAILFDGAKMLAYTMDRAGIRGARDFMVPIPPPPPPAPSQEETVQGVEQTQRTQVIEPTGIARQINRISTKFPITKKIENKEGQREGQEAPR